jgi:hypothetical protein
VKELENVKVGDKITRIKTYFGRNAIWSFATVAKVNTRFVLDSEGGKWGMDGYAWGASGWHRGDGRCTPYKPEHDAMAEAANELMLLERMRSRLGDVRWKDIDDDTVRKVYAMVKKAKPEANP